MSTSKLSGKPGKMLGGVGGGWVKGDGLASLSLRRSGNMPSRFILWKP